MTTQIQRRRGTTAQHSTFTGAVGEVTVDTDKEVLVVHDGAQVGGYPQMRENGSNSALALGSAGTPSLKFSGDPNTGIYSPGADQLALSTNGTGRLFINADGNIGIGDSTASEALNILRGTGASAYARFRGNNGSPGAFVIGQDTAGLTRLFQESAQPITFWINNTERLRITGAGLVGVGNSAPQALIHAGRATSDVAVPTGNFAVIRGGDYATAGTGGIQLSGGYGDSGRIGAFNIKAVGSGAGAGTFVNDLLFTTTASYSGTEVERMRLDSSGRLGIGDNLPDSTLTIKAAASTTPLRVSGPSSEFLRCDQQGRLLVGTSSARTNFYNSTLDSQILLESNSTTSGRRIMANVHTSATDSGPIYLFAKGRSASIGGNEIVSSNDKLGTITFQGNDGAEFVNAALIEAQVDGTPGANDMPGRIVLSTTASGASSPTERMRITSSGQTQWSNAVTPVLRVENPNNVSGDGVADLILRANAGNTSSYHLRGNTNSVGNWYLYGNGTTSYSSDQRLKKNIETTRDGYLADICQLRVVKYNWNSHEDGAPKELGLIAQEVEQVFPGLVQEDLSPLSDDDPTLYKQLKGSVLPVILLKALQEAAEKIETLEAKVAALESA